MQYDHAVTNFAFRANSYVVPAGKTIADHRVSVDDGAAMNTRTVTDAGRRTAAGITVAEYDVRCNFRTGSDFIKRRFSGFHGISMQWVTDFLVYRAHLSLLGDIAVV